MKSITTKAISILLTLLVILFCSLSACTDDQGAKVSPDTSPDIASPPPDDGKDAEPEIDLSKTKPCEYVREKLDAGMQVIVGCTMIEDVPMLMEVWAGEIKNKLEPEGVTVNITAAGGDMAVMINQIENFVTMGAACVITIPTDTLAIQEIAKVAMEAGVQIMTWGVEESDYTIAVRNNVVGKGRLEGEMAAAWAKMRYPDATAENPVKVAFFRDDAVTSKVAMCDATAEAVQASGTNVIVYTQNGNSATLDDAFLAAENALTYDPDIRIFVTHIYTAAVGASNYVMSQPHLDPSEFGAFGLDEDPVAVDMIDNMSANNEAILRGCSVTTDSPGVRLGNAAYEVLFDGVIAPRLYYAEVFSHSDGTY